MLLVLLGIGGALTKQTQGSVLNSVILQTALRGNYNVNKYRMVFIRLIEIYMRSVSARSERSRVCKKRHPGGDCSQRPQRGTGKRRTHLHETTDGECECHQFLLFTSCVCLTNTIFTCLYILTIPKLPGIF